MAWEQEKTVEGLTLKRLQAPAASAGGCPPSLLASGVWPRAGHAHAGSLSFLIRPANVETVANTQGVLVEERLTGNGYNRLRRKSWTRFSCYQE